MYEKDNKEQKGNESLTYNEKSICAKLNMKTNVINFFFLPDWFIVLKIDKLFKGHQHSLGYLTHIIYLIVGREQRWTT